MSHYQIGYTSLTLNVTAGANQITALEIATLPVEIEFSFRPGYAGHITADAGASEEGWPDEFEIISVKTDEEIEVRGDGLQILLEESVEILPLLTREQINSLAEKLQAPEYEY